MWLYLAIMTFHICSTFSTFCCEIVTLDLAIFNPHNFNFISPNVTLALLQLCPWFCIFTSCNVTLYLVSYHFIFTVWVYILHEFFPHNFNIISHQVTLNCAIITEIVTLYLAVMTFSHIYYFILHKVTLHFAVTTFMLWLYILLYFSTLFKLYVSQCYFILHSLS